MWGAGGDFGGGGGGFVSSQGQFSSPAQGQGEKSRTRRSNNVIPVTVKQILECQDENLVVAGNEAHVVTIVGLVTTVEQSTTKVSIHVDDQTGVVECVNYLGSGEGEGRPEAPFVPLEGSYGRVVGQLRTMKGSKYLVIFKFLPVLDLNELTAHLLEVVQVEMKLKKVKEAEAQRIGMTNDGFNNVLSKSMVAGMNNVPSGMPRGSNMGSSAVPNRPGFNPTKPDHNMVMTIIHSCQEASGIHKNEILRNCKGRLNAKQIEKILDDLSGEGHIYSTVDDDHFKFTD